MYYTYVLEDNLGKLYIGQTNNLQNRLIRHNSQRSKYTAKSNDWRMIYSKEFATRAEAMQYEKYLKSLKNPEYIKSKIISG